MGKINSRAKGANGEREFAKILSARGFKSRRGQQFSGIGESPDVLSQGLPGLHWEVKRVEKLNITEALQQSIRDAKGLLGVVAHRRNGEQWKVTLDLEDFLCFFAPSLVQLNLTHLAIAAKKALYFSQVKDTKSINLTEQAKDAL